MKKKLFILAAIAVNSFAVASPAKAAWETDICEGTQGGFLACCTYCLFFGCDC